MTKVNNLEIAHNRRKPRNKCRQCGKECNKPSAIYCSLKHQQMYQRGGFAKDTPSIYGVCVRCSKDIIRPENQYCTATCHKEHQYETFIAAWQSGAIPGGTTKSGASQHVKRYVWEKYNGKCSRCGWAEIHPKLQKPPLEIEHIDGNYLNNTESNLTLLCPNCHALTDTYRGLNYGNGRGSRKKLQVN